MKVGPQNELFIQDRKIRNSLDLDGSGIGSGSYNKNAEFVEKIKNASLTIVLLLLTIVLSIIFVCYAFRCSNIASSYNKATLEPDSAGLFHFHAPNGITYALPASRLIPQDAVTIYYPEERYWEIEVIPKAYEWAVGFGTLFIVYVLLIRSLYKNFHTTHHSIQKKSD